MAAYCCLSQFITTVTELTPRPLTAKDLSALWMLWFCSTPPETALDLLEDHDDRDMLTIARGRLNGALERTH